ncbi:AbrB/MazE/SpoVT family DNA-binding domain-containing protein [Allorhizobium sp. NPDC080224]|uniref:AbrB/MazE/SpoVT family DNA-binding domain-containing protein n=1 Tax=Allorhizobium sp. NPDC080224 TaxID=3390547 RepID=UPI003D048E00
MTKLSITAKGQVTLRKEVLQHLGLRPGDKVAVDLLPDGRAALSAVRSERTFADLAQMLEGRTNGRSLSVDELNEAIASAGALAGKGSDRVP